tara:strand:- start:466 stop:1344 length:879 start_codon:yes stop_codon:yes gene_type:complete
MPKPKIDAYQVVTDKIIASLEAGTAPWQRPWSVSGFGGLPVRFNGQSYNGINTLLLWLQGRSAPTWMTYNQAKKLGGQVKKGEKGSLVVFFKQLRITETNDAGEEEAKSIPLLRYYTVFNVEQIADLPARFYPEAAESQNGDDHIAEVEAYVANTQAVISHGGDRAYYRPSTDEIQLPEFDQFEDAISYYGTVLHELAHWTGTKSRLDRPFGAAKGDPDYAKEELVAEIAAAFASASLGIEIEPREDHASYLASWLQVLKGDKKAIFKAAAAAQKAVDHLNSLQEESLEEAA